MTGLCRRCYTKKINRRVLDRLEREIKPLTANNADVFAKYLESTRARFVTDADVALARKFADYLSKHPIGPITSWSDVFTVSKAVNLHYVRSPKKTGCPILQIGRHLDELGFIEPLREEKITDRSRQLALLREPVQSWAREYFAEVSRGHPAIYGLCAITIIRRWADHLGSKSFADATEDDARAFINTLPAESLEQAGNLIRHMTAFCDWAVKQSYLESNPFLNLRQPRVKRRCRACGKERIFRHQGDLCHHCDGHERYSKKTKLLEWEAAELPSYSRDIFNLFVRYVHRYQLESRHYNDAKLLLSFLQRKKTIPRLDTWSSVEKISSDLDDFAMSFGGIKMGCPIMKIGCVLQELGVLPIREEGYVLGINKKLSGLSHNLITPLQRYIEHLRKSRRNEKTVLAIVHKFRKFHDWLKLNHDIDPWSVSEQVARDYLGSVEEDIFKARQPLNRLYRWAKAERYVLSNPFEKIAVSLRKPSLKVCSDEQIKKVQAFIRSPRSNPEAALMLALTFYWGVTCKEITFATVEFETEGVKIIFHRGALTYGNSRYRRDQVLTLPQDPQWLKSLQGRFAIDWQKRFSQVHADLPRRPLILHPLGRHNRPLTTLCARKIYYRAIEKAAGVRIPPNVLRRAGADFYTQKNGSGILQRLGWSKSYAFHFTWMPRQLFRPRDISK